MKSELLYLLLTAIPDRRTLDSCRDRHATSRGPLRPEHYCAAPAAPLPDWVNPANRAHQNAVENIAPFAAVVLIAYAIGLSTPTT